MLAVIPDFDIAIMVPPCTNLRGGVYFFFFFFFFFFNRCIVLFLWYACLLFFFGISSSFFLSVQLSVCILYLRIVYIDMLMCILL